MRLERLVSQMLILGRLEPSAQAPDPQRVDVTECAREVLGELASLQHTRHIDMELVAPEDPLWAAADPLAVQLVIRNLVDNAIRYAARGRVIVRLRPGDHEVCLDVEDSGEGIPAADRARVLDRFFRRLGTGQDGSGLGLSIVHRVVQIYGGVLDLDESPELGGLRVRVRFRSAAAE